MPSAVSRLPSLEAAYALAAESGACAQPRTSTRLGALPKIFGSWVSLVVSTTRPPSATAGRRSLASR
jgi:hypothetical protein